MGKQMYAGFFRGGTSARGDEGGVRGHQGGCSELGVCWALQASLDHVY